MNYFEWFDLPISFNVDLAELKRKFYALSQQFHPDFYTQKTSAEKQNSQELSSFNNEAFGVLKDFDKRMKYILELKGLLSADQKAEVSPTFLMEMMDINEELMELEMEFDQNKFDAISSQIQDLIAERKSKIEDLLSQEIHAESSSKPLKPILNFYLEKRYLLRLSTNLKKLQAQ